jgi:hypothetical protein
LPKENALNDSRNYFSDIVKWFRKQKQKDSDVIFHLSSKKICAHKFIIQSTCPKLYKEIEKFSSSEDSQTHVYLEFTEKISYPVFGVFVESLYNFGLELSSLFWENKQFTHLLKLAEFYDHRILVNVLNRKLKFQDVEDHYFQKRISLNLDSFIRPKVELKQGNGVVKLIMNDGVLFAHKYANLNSHFQRIA